MGRKCWVFLLIVLLILLSNFVCEAENDDEEEEESSGAVYIVTLKKQFAPVVIAKRFDPTQELITKAGRGTSRFSTRRRRTHKPKPRWVVTDFSYIFALLRLMGPPMLLVDVVLFEVHFCAHSFSFSVAISCV